MNLSHGAIACVCLAALFGGDLYSLVAGPEAVEQTFPGVEVLGTNYPVPPSKLLLSRGVLVVQMGVLAIMLAGDRIFPALGVEPPALYRQYQQNKMMVCAAAWFLGNALQSALTATGAFEVFYDGQQVFSKLAAGRVPALDEVLRPIAAAQAAVPSVPR